MLQMSRVEHADDHGRCNSQSTAGKSLDPCSATPADLSFVLCPQCISYDNRLANGSFDVPTHSVLSQLELVNRSMSSERQLCVSAHIEAAMHDEHAKICRTPDNCYSPYKQAHEWKLEICAVVIKRCSQAKKLTGREHEKGSLPLILTMVQPEGLDVSPRLWRMVPSAIPARQIPMA